MPAASTERLRGVLEPAVTAAGYDLEDVAVSAAGRRSVVRVVVDRDGGLDLDAVADVSRVVSGLLDDSDVLGESPYVLEVTSPGVDRPLTHPRHWRRNVGRLVTVDQVTGRVVEVSDDALVLDVDGAQQTLAMPGLGAGHVQVEFRHNDDVEADA